MPRPGVRVHGIEAWFAQRPRGQGRGNRCGWGCTVDGIRNWCL